MSKEQFLKDNLSAGEEYAGILLGENGEPDLHIILLPGEAPAANLETQEAWAASIGGRLPSCREQSLLFANLKKHFKPAWYWSGEKDALAGWAWCQNFDYGLQSTIIVSNTLRARAVRSESIE